MRKMEGECRSLPQAPLVNTIMLREDRLLCQDGGDLQSCVKRLYLPANWPGRLRCPKRSQRQDFCGAPGSSYVAIRALPMDWISSVD